MAESITEIDFKLEKVKQYLESNQIPSAHTLIDQIIQLNPNYPPSIVAYAEVLLCESQYKAAHTYLDQAEVIDPEYSNIYDIRSRIYLLEEKMNESSQAFSRYQELAGESQITDSNPNKPLLIYTQRRAKRLIITFSGFCIFIIVSFIALILFIE